MTNQPTAHAAADAKVTALPMINITVVFRMGAALLSTSYQQPETRRSTLWDAHRTSKLARGALSTVQTKIGNGSTTVVRLFAVKN